VRKITFLIFTIFLFLQNGIFAQEKKYHPEKQFQAGLNFFQEKKYEEAITQFESILSKGYESSETYFNLGNCYAEKKEWGKAILNFERALLHDPRNKNIQNNLSFANSKTVDDIEIIPNFFLAQWWQNVRNFTSSGVWSLLGILFLWVGIAGMILWILGKERVVRKRGFLGGLASLILCLLFFGLSFSSMKTKLNSGEAIILTPKIALYPQPSEKSTPILSIHEGTKVEIVEKLTSWYKVRLENGEVGWIVYNALEKI